MMGEGRQLDVEAVTEGVLINNSRSDTPSWVHAPLSILTVDSSAPGRGSALVEVSDEPLDVGQLVVQILAALLLLVVVGAVL